jgi:hypothetical protein
LLTWAPVAKKARTPKPPRLAASAERRVQAPQRRAGTQKRPQAAAPPRGMRFFWPLAAVVVALVIVGIALGIALTRGASKPPKLALAGPVSWKDLPGLQTGKPPWPNNSATLTSRLSSLGVNALSQEALAFHIHQHLDVFVDGKHVTVPIYIGIHIDQQTPSASFLTELHTHHADGIIHVESAQHLNYQLKQFFGEWGVRLTSKCLGSFKGSCDNLQWWVNGVKRTGDPANLILKNHEEIVITVGTPPAKIPSGFDFAAHGV